MALHMLSCLMSFGGGQAALELSEPLNRDVGCLSCYVKCA